MADKIEPKRRRPGYARRRRSRSRAARFARNSDQARLRDALDAIRGGKLVQHGSLPPQAELLEGIADAIQRLIDAIDRFHGDPDEEPEEDVGADDFGETED